MNPTVLTIAGSDSGGGAGIQADLKTFSALGAYGASVLTALTAQNTRGVQAIHDVPSPFVAAQIDSVFGDLSVGAVKVGMLSRPAVIEAVAAGLRRFGARHVVVDPVMVSTSGDRLLAPDALEALRTRLIPLADVITPNLPEAAELLGEAVATDVEAAAEQGRRLLSFGCRAVLVKGGHGTGHGSDDVLVMAGHELVLRATRIPTRNTHGTGCTLSAAIAALLAHGHELPDAVREAKIYLTEALSAADRLSVGSGPGPVHHFHRWW